METVKLIKVVDDGNSSQDFIEEYKAIVEWYVDGEIEGAEPIRTLDELFLVLGVEKLLLQNGEKDNV